MNGEFFSRIRLECEQRLLCPPNPNRSWIDVRDERFEWLNVADWEQREGGFQPVRAESMARQVAGKNGSARDGGSRHVRAFSHGLY